MSSSLIMLLRILHILTGVFWVGTIMFLNMLLGPSAAAVGPDGAKVIQELVRRGYFEKIILAATTTIITGLILVWNYVHVAGMSWFGLPFGRGISTGMLAAILAWVVGLFLVRPAMLEMLALGGQAAQASGPAKDALMGQVAAARARVIRNGGISMMLLIVAVIAMAVARYL